MKVKNRKAALFFSAASMAVILLDVVLPDMRKSDFAVQDFVRGLMSGMGTITVVVWLVYMIRNIRKSYKANDALVPGSKDKNIFLAAAMTVLLIASVAATYFTNNIFVSAACFVTISASYVLNFIYVKRMRQESICKV